ncbi:unnamed protein product, partial [Mycena citricolor]
RGLRFTGSRNSQRFIHFGTPWSLTGGFAPDPTMTMTAISSRSRSDQRRTDLDQVGRRDCSVG